jgi:hypothetical protein
LTQLKDTELEVETLK